MNSIYGYIVPVDSIDMLEKRLEQRHEQGVKLNNAESSGTTEPKTVKRVEIEVSSCVDCPFVNL